MKNKILVFLDILNTLARIFFKMCIVSLSELYFGFSEIQCLVIGILGVIWIFYHELRHGLYIWVNGK